MSSAALLRRLEALEMTRDGGFLIYTHEEPDGKGGLILISTRNATGKMNEVGRVAAGDREEHRANTVRLDRGYLLKH